MIFFQYYQKTSIPIMAWNLNAYSIFFSDLTYIIFFWVGETCFNWFPWSSFHRHVTLGRIWQKIYIDIAYHRSAKKLTEIEFTHFMSSSKAVELSAHKRRIFQWNIVTDVSAMECPGPLYTSYQKDAFPSNYDTPCFNLSFALLGLTAYQPPPVILAPVLLAFRHCCPVQTFAL